jgi:hypothetical protein
VICFCISKISAQKTLAKSPRMDFALTLGLFLFDLAPEKYRPGKVISQHR